MASNTDGECVRKFRERIGLRRTEFGAKIGYSHEQVQRLEEGRAALTDELREKICREYGISEDQLKMGPEGQESSLGESAEERRKRMRMVYKESGLTQREFGKRTHTATSMLNDVMSGRKQLTIRYAKKLEETLGVGADWLLYGDEKAKEYPLSDAMINYLKDHPEIRKEIQEKMAMEVDVTDKAF